MDAVVGTQAAPTAIFKTGSAALISSSVAQIRSDLPNGYQNIPIRGINP